MGLKKYEVVISGVAACLPECDNLYDLEEKIFEGQNLVTDDDRKWPTREFDVPRQVGKIRDPFKFDQQFFGVHRRLCLVMDVHLKQSLERAYECICDAGLNPADLSGAKIAVLMSSMTSESEYGSVMLCKNSDHAMLGHSRSMQSNRISYFFNFIGPSFVVDSSWVGGLQVLKMAEELVSSGQCTAAIVGASNLIFGPEGSVHYDGLRRLNYDGKTKSYSADCDGYSRSEGIVTLFIQRAEDALRSYGSLVNISCSTEMVTNCTFPDYVDFDKFLEEIYSDLDIDLNSIGYVEGDGCASLKVDAMELNTLEEIICKKRKRPLLVGSIKSMLGHTESASCLVSLVNALMVLRTGYIPPTINYSSPNPLVPALKDGTIKINTEKTKFEGDYVAVSTFGVNSSYGHVVIKKAPSKTNIPLQIKDSQEMYFPKLLIASGRDEEVLNRIININKAKSPDNELFYMVQNVFRKSHPQHLYRFYIAFGEIESDSEYKLMPFQSGAERPLWFVFSGMGSQWPTMGTQLLKIPLVRKSIQICHDVLVPRGLNLIELITNPEPSVYDNILHSFVGIAAIQIALVDLLTAIGIIPDGIVGHSVGELGCAYADGCLTREQTILAAYARGKASNDAELIKGMMAAVGKGYKDIVNELPEGIEAACHNSSTSCTLSGPADLVAQYVEELKSRGIFAKLVNVSNIAYHSKNIKPAAPFLLNYLKEIIPEPKMRSQKWISSSVEQSRWNTELAKYCSAEYHTNNLLSYVLFEEATTHIPKNAVTIEIAPHGLLQAILKRSLATCTNIPLTSRTQIDSIFFLHKSLGQLYSCGVLMDLTKLHSNCSFPVSQSCDYVHPFISWEHSEDWIPISLEFTVKTKETNSRWHNIKFTPDNDDLQHSRINNIHDSDGILPAVHFLDILMSIVDEKQANIPLTFSAVKFYEKLVIEGELSVIDACILRQDGYGDFEVITTTGIGALVISGQVMPTEKPWVSPDLTNDISSQKDIYHIEQNQIYSYFAEYNRIYTNNFRTIKSIVLFEKGFKGTISWKGITYFVHSLLKAVEFYHSLEKDELCEVYSVGTFTINRKCLPQLNEDVEIYYDHRTDEILSRFFVMRQITVKPVIDLKSNHFNIHLRSFIPYGKLDLPIKETFYHLCAQLIDENMYGIKKNSLLTIVNSERNSNLALNIHKAFASVSTRKVEIQFLSAEKVASEAEISLLRGMFPSFLFLVNDLSEAKAMGLSSAKEYPQFIVQCTSSNLEGKYDYLSLIAYHNFDGYNLGLYKMSHVPKKMVNCIVHPDGQLLTKITAGGNGIHKERITFVVINYKSLSNIINTLKKVHSMEGGLVAGTTRYIFLEEGSQFDPSLPQFKEQMQKDLFINILKDNSWGSLRFLDISEEVAFDDLHEPSLPLSKISCKNFSIKCIGLNTSDVVYTNIVDENMGVIEYSGFQENGELIFGLGKMTNENIIVRDPILWWKKPSDWSIQEATTVPLFYTLAYYIVKLIIKEQNYRYESLLIHAGHTPFGQALIHTALSQRTRVFTTCYTEGQKKFILEKFPQLYETGVFLIGSKGKDVFVSQLKEKNNGVGVNVVVNPVDSYDMVLPSMQATAFLGRYFQVGKNSFLPAYSDRTFGLAICDEELGIFGVNPENLLTLAEGDKIDLKSMISMDLLQLKITPLLHQSIDGHCTVKEALKRVVKEHEQEIPKKIQLSLDEQPPQNQQALHLDGKTYLIIGGMNGLWYDLVVWLSLKGAKNLYIVADQNTIPTYLKRRFKNFAKRHPASKFEFMPISVIQSHQNCENMIKTINKTTLADAVIYMSGGIEDYLDSVDQVLRRNWPKCKLVCIGAGDEICESRKTAGFPGSCLVLQRSSFRNKPLLGIFYKLLLTPSNSNDVLTVDCIEGQGDLQDKKVESYLPENMIELITLMTNATEEPGFREIPTHAPNYTCLRGLNPLFVIPGFKTAKMKQMLGKLSYPAFIATLPEHINSLDDVSAKLAKYLEDNFDLSMYTILAENWSGALALATVKNLELLGKSAELILLDAAPSTAKDWRSTAQPSNNILSKYCPANISNMDLDELSKYSSKMSETMARLEPGDWDSFFIKKSVDCLLNRLSLLQSFKESSIDLSAKIHLFRPSSCLRTDTCNVDKMSKIPIEVHISEEDDWDSILTSRRVVAEINSLVLLEYKYVSKQQEVGAIGTLDLLLDAKFQTEGLTRA